VRHDLEGGVHVAATDLIVVQELNGECRARSWRNSAPGSRWTSAHVGYSRWNARMP
jgi:hypothetical protein